MPVDSDSIGYSGSTKPIWNLYQFGLSALCFISVPVLFKLPIDQYFGSGWTLLSLFLFIFILAPPIIYIQLRLGSTWNVGILGVMDRHLPLGIIFSIGCFLRNFIHVIYSSALITHCLIYIFFSMYNCDGKVCFGGTYPWSSCRDAWAEGDCRDGIKLVLRNPTAEEKFYQNFMFMQSNSIASTIAVPDWFLYFGIIAVPHLISWILLFLVVIGGAKVFGKILYGLIPLGVILLTSIFIYIVAKYANSESQSSAFFNRFFTRFPIIMPVVTTSWDQYAYEPLLWGFFSIFAHLSIGMNLWNGVYPIMGKWIGYGKKRTHLSWLIIILVFASFVIIPTVMSIAVLASSFSDIYLRCHVVRDWAFPFTVVAHVFTKFASHKALAVAYYVALLCFLLASEGFLLVASLESIMDHIQQWHHNIASQVDKYYRIGCVITILTSYLLSLTTILKSGYYWIYLMDFYVDRLMCLLMIGQWICFIVIYAFSKSAKLEGKLLKLFFIIFLVIFGLILFTVMIWYSVDARSVSPTKDCYYERLDPKIDPIPDGYVGLGWLIAASPFLIGLVIGPIVIYVNSRKFGGLKFCTYILHGYRRDALPRGMPDEDKMIEELNKADKTKMTTLDTMQKMKGTLQSSNPWIQPSFPQASRTISSDPSAIYFNQVPNSSANVMFEQPQSIRRPLISPEPDSDFISPPESTSLEYAKIKKTKRLPRVDISQSDV